MFERLTDRSRRVLVLAQEEAKDLHHDYIGTGDMLLGLLREGEGIAARALQALGVTLDGLRAEVVRLAAPSSSPAQSSLPLTARATEVIEYSLREARKLGHHYIGPEHMLLGLVREGDGTGAKVLLGLGIEPAQVRDQVMRVIGSKEGPETA